MSDTKLLTYGTGVDTLLTTTLSAVRGKRARDAVFNEIPTLAWLEKKRKVKQAGGASLLIPIMSGSNSTTTAYTGYQTLDVTPQEGGVMAQATWRNYATSVSISGPEERANKGESAVIKLLNFKKDQALKSLRNTLSQNLWATTQNSKNIQALPVLVDQTTSTQDIARSGNSWWQAQLTASGSFAARGLSDMRNLFNTIRKQSTDTSAPDLVVTTQAVFEFYEGVAEPKQRYEDMKVADQGFENLRYKTAQMFYDENTPSGNLFMLNTDALELVINSEADFDTSDFVKPANQDALVAQILVQLALVTDNPRQLGKLTGITA